MESYHDSHHCFILNNDVCGNILLKQIQENQLFYMTNNKFSRVLSESVVNGGEGDVDVDIY